MSPKLPRIPAAELLRALRRDGWIEDRQSGSHVVLYHPSKSGRAVVPRHAGKVMSSGTLSGILSDAGLTMDDLRRLL